MVFAGAARADPDPSTVRGHAVRRSGPIAIDGHLVEVAWRDAPKQTNFTQRMPNDGAKATLETRFAILYDDDALYVGVWADDSDPEQIRALLSRRDTDSPADGVAVAIDSHHDRRTAYLFQLSAAGVQRDVLLFDDGNGDESWDAVWTGATAIDSHGWTAEFRIPLNQLRFSTGAAQEWGFQIFRIVGRSQEQTTWSRWPRSAPEIVSKFGVIDGIDQLKSGRRIEILPYALGGVAVAPIAAGDPLNTRTTMRRNFGLDLRYGLGPAFTLSMAINPDFGQVEADPSQITLGPYELFFPEKRPLFLESVDLFKLPIGNGDDPTETAFYSRRIGAAPANQPADYRYIHWPAATSIYGAMKLSGKTRGGWSVGVLDAVTGEETAEIVDAANMRMSALVAPLTNYAAARLKRDLSDGQTSLGASVTAVDRALDGTPLASTLHDHAYTGGLQLQHRWGDNAWKANFHVIGSWVHGSPDAIAATQKDANHLFQRPDATDAHLDPMRTSLGGFGTTWQIGRFGDTKHWRFMFAGDLRSPGLELNDLGFQTGSDRVSPLLWAQYRDETPSAHILNWQLTSDLFAVSTFEPTVDNVGIEGNASVQLASYWTLAGGYRFDDARWSQVALRGGPALRLDPGTNGWLNVQTDTRRSVWFSLALNGSYTPASGATQAGIDVGATIQARSNIDIFVGPSFARRDDPMQYVVEAGDPSGQSHNVFAAIRQRTASLTLRMNWTFSPRLALQAYAQPFVASGRYSDFKDVEQPHARSFGSRFHRFGDGEHAVVDGAVVIDRNLDGIPELRFDRPDFNLRQLRSTIVLRWEYLPGSTVFAIWSHGQTSSLEDGRFRIGRDLADLANADSDNTVMLKVNYWIGL